MNKQAPAISAQGGRVFASAPGLARTPDPLRQPPMEGNQMIENPYSLQGGGFAIGAVLMSAVFMAGVIVGCLLTLLLR